MTAGNRATKYENLYKSLKKHFKPAADAPERSVLEHLVYACCLEDAKYEQADEAFAKLQQTYFDWNEVRVTTVAELSEALHSLPFANQASTRIKQCLQSLFESRYQYDLDDLKKANLGKAVAELEAWKGISPFILNYVSQHALGGHSVPAGILTLDALVMCDVISPAEAEKKTVPGVERAIPKNKGIEFASLLHQFALELHLHHKAAAPSSVLKELGVTYKAKEKIPEKKAPAAPVKSAMQEAALKQAAAKAAEAKSAPPSKKPDPKGAKSPNVKKALEPMKPSVKKSEVKPEIKPAAAKGETSKLVPKTAPPKKPAVPTKPEPTAKKTASTKPENGKGSKDKSPVKPTEKQPDKSKGSPSASDKKKTPSKPNGSPSVGSSITKKKPK
jgi:endonuclease III